MAIKSREEARSLMKEIKRCRKALDEKLSKKIELLTKAEKILGDIRNLLSEQEKLVDMLDDPQKNRKDIFEKIRELDKKINKSKAETRDLMGEVEEIDKDFPPLERKIGSLHEEEKEFIRSIETN